MEKREVQHTGGTFGSRGNFVVVMVMILGVFVAILNETLLNVALSKIMADIGISPSKAQWLTTGYLLVIGVLIPITAYLLQRFTTRSLFLSAMGLFTVGTFIAAISPGFALLVTGRVLQAAGTGLLFPLLTNVVFAIVSIEKRGSAMGTIGIVITFAPAIGPTLSGIIVEHFSWRVLFYGVLPIALFVIGFAYAKLKNVTETTNPKIDVISLLLSTFGFGGIVYGFSSAGESHGGWTGNGVLIPIVTGAVSLGLFVWRQLVIPQPLLDLRAFGYKVFRISTLIMMIVMMAMFSAMMLLPIFLQNALGYSPLEAGLVMLPGGVVMGIMSPITGRLFDKFGARWLAVIGLALIGNTLWQFAIITLSTSYGMIMLLNTLLMLGISMLMMPVMTNALNELPPPLYPHGTAIIGTLQQVSGAVGTALLVTVMTNGSKRFLESPSGAQNDATGKILAMLAGMKSAFLLAFALIAVAWACSLFLRRAAAPEKEPGGKRVSVH
ncbi:MULTISPECIES: MDR family MFS transporter [Brevibacillus]|uniref:MDR family MFS transporter n=1 Tax=Brevibacillus TaxID=55080 RepID=UPI001172855B|nr:MDR family MFS transporter [Brevibacillus borstelensis]KKX56321.1 multidrug MFS transporter [Brevibacillus borstelensis cifa_chp40]MCC0566687.1 DHA2 family efflux MFS transporter permease subunit [Brevibacillus borstelensis]MCM3470546.1 DHA2 family efflux MFS transporter permease subunit [Brevibacillus borstelensis]MCM3558100.1 DHA2 family efflux MFS transporter permease subunit [Brevibacillus borstelensis]MCM3592955.1 DHA2 family efflux MFS transporter permease subunit [Brevibacillus borst